MLAKTNKIWYSVLRTECGSSSTVERRLPKANVAGSNPVSRSTHLRYESAGFLLSFFFYVGCQ